MIKWIDIIWPFRLILKGINYWDTKDVIKRYTPQSYNPFLVLPEYRRELSQLNKTNRLISFKPNSDEFQQKIDSTNQNFVEGKTNYMSGGEGAFFLGADVVDKYHAVDEYVYEGMSNLSGQSLDNLASLSGKAQTYQGDFWNGLSDAAVGKVGGHIGEVYAAESLQDKGLDVEWPTNSNQEGWDLLVGGHEVNVKIVEDANALSAHFLDNPDIAVVIPHDAKNIPSDAINIGTEEGVEEFEQALMDGQENIVAYDPNLSHAEIMTQTEDATDLLTGSADIFDLYLPILTAGISGHREVKLLIHGKTDILSSFKNFGLDFVGTGGGGFVGAKSGAMIGSLFSPIGTVVGGLIGGGVGAIYGRKASDKAKKKKFENALDDFQVQEKIHNSRVKTIIREARREIDVFKKQKETELNNEAKRIKEETNLLKNQLIDKRNKLYNLDFPNYIKLIAQGKTEIQNYKDNYQDLMKSRNKWMSLLLPMEYEFAYDSLMKKYSEDIKTLEEFKLNYNNQKSIQLIQALADMGVAKNEILEFFKSRELKRVEDEHELRQKIKSSQTIIQYGRKIAITEVKSIIVEVRKKSHRLIKTETNKFLIHIENLKVEGRKLGLNMD
ncbi:hypothetical protein [Winogradskyella sp.]|uniref:hypothetical protein n=1 Tax=Winogradskyella sp. TaxID=1883156 RepID=UPI003AB49810